jgi:hypothetical protein
VIAIQINLAGAPELIAKSNRIRSLVSRVTLNAIRRVVRRHITTTKQDIRTQSGIGRSIWGKNASGLNTIVSLIRARMTPEMIETGIKLKGLPKMIEEGGRTKPFQMHPYGNKFAKKVTHPGAPIRAHHFAQTQLLRASPLIVREVEISLGRLVGNDRGLGA